MTGFKTEITIFKTRIVIIKPSRTNQVPDMSLKVELSLNVPTLSNTQIPLPPF